MEIKNGYCIWLDFLVVTPVNYWKCDEMCEQINTFDKKYSQYLFSFYGQ